MKRASFLICLLIIASLLAACSTPEPEIIEKEVTRVIKATVVETVIVAGTPQTVEQEVTKVVEVEKIVTATPEVTPAPAVGGKLVYALPAEPDTLDVHKSSGLVMENVMQYVGASLVAKDPLTGDLVPYLAESWTVAEDGLTYELILRKDVKFHDGTPLTAHEYAWTFQRALDPTTKSPVAGTMLTGVVSAEAVDDYTLRLKLAWPNYPLLESLLQIFLQPLNPTYVEQMGDAYGRHPMSVGPYVFKEWQTGEKIVLERNPDFNWGPEYTHGGAPLVETIEFRIIPEYATTFAGLESGEIDFYVGVLAKDVDRLESTGRFQILGSLLLGVNPMVNLNVSKPPFDDVRVRQAFNLAVDRDALIQVIMLGRAIPQYGPVSSSMPGYWPGVEYIGYGYDLDKAKALMEEAGYTYNDDGMLEVDGQPLALVLKAYPRVSKVAEILQEQFKALGVEIQIEQQESSILGADYDSGNYTLGLAGWTHPDISVLYAMFHSSMIGVMNSGFVNDPEVDQFLVDMLFTADHKVHQEAAIALQRRVVEQAYIIPLYTPTIIAALNNKVQGAVFPPIPGYLLELYDAYIEME